MKKQLWRLPLLSLAIVILFYLVKHFIFNSITNLEQIKLLKTANNNFWFGLPNIINLPVAISELWNIVSAPILVFMIILALYHCIKITDDLLCEIFDKNIFFFGLIIGLIIGLALCLSFGPVFGIILIIIFIFKVILLILLDGNPKIDFAFGFFVAQLIIIGLTTNFLSAIVLGSIFWISLLVISYTIFYTWKTWEMIKETSNQLFNESKIIRRFIYWLSGR